MAWRVWAAALAVTAIAAGTPTAAQGAAADPLFVFVPIPPFLPGSSATPPPYGYFNGPCGMGVDGAGNFYVSNYYHDQVDIYQPDANYKSSSGATGYLGQLSPIDPLDGPCGVAIDSANGLIYVNDYHRSVVGFPASSPGSETVLTGAGVNSSRPTGVAVDPETGRVYVDERTYIGVYEPSGAPVEEAGAPVRIGSDGLADYYGLAERGGLLYVADAATDTVKVFNPALDRENPVSEIDGSGTPNGHFTSLRDSALAVDRVTGELYVIDDLQPDFAETPKALVYVFSALGTYEGHLKFAISDALPSGLAVDNSSQPTQGRVYVTSGNSDLAGVYGYGPGAATNATPVGPVVRLTMRTAGEGSIASSTRAAECTSSCEEQIRSGLPVSLSAAPSPGSDFEGWSGACSGTQETCTVQMDEAAAVTATFEPVVGASAAGSQPTAVPGPTSTVPPPRAAVHQRARHHRTRHKSRHHRRHARSKRVR